MNAAPRYGASLAMVAALHLGAIWLLLQSHSPPVFPQAVPEAILLDLPPAPAPMPEPAPPIAEPPAPLVPTPPILEPPPAPPVVQPDVALPPPPTALPRPAPPPRTVLKKAAPRAASPPQGQTAAPISEPQVRPAPAAPPAPLSNALPAWRGEVSARLQEAKRYPNSARQRGEQGVATVSFTVDSSGHVTSAELVRSSGTPSLDAEAVALIHRAEPLPPPPDMPSVTLTVPISFSLN